VVWSMQSELQLSYLKGQCGGFVKSFVPVGS